MKFPVNPGVIFLCTVAMTMGLASALQSNAPRNPQSLTSTICDNRTDGRDNRCEVELDVPAVCVDATSSSSSCPIVFFLHGGGGSNDGFKGRSGVHDEGIIGVYPQGENGWNTGPKNSNLCHWSDFVCQTDPDEGDFIASIIAELRSQGASGNIYAIGSSNGAALAHRLASNAGDALPIKGIVTKVTQLLASPERSGPGILNYNQPSSSAERTTPAVSVLSVMGTEDGLIPYDGGSSSVFGGDEAFELMPTLGSMKVWATHNGCSGTPTESVHSSDMGTGIVSKYEYTGCPNGVVVEHYAVQGGGHNAGGVSIDGEPMNYVLAYDFIRRVDDAIIMPPSAPPPVASPVAPPVASPVAPPTCTNDPSWAGKFNTDHNCDFVGANPGRRCSWENTQGIRAEVACPEACNPDCQQAPVPVPSPIPAPIPAPVSAPVSAPTPDSSCANDPNWAGKFNDKHTCDFVGASPDRRCSWKNTEGIRAKVACPEACNPDCRDSENNVRRGLRRRQVY